MPGKIKSPILIMTRKKLERTKTNAIKEHQKRLKEIKESQTYQNKKANVNESKKIVDFTMLRRDHSKLNASLKKEPKGSLRYSQLLNSKNIVESALNLYNLNIKFKHYKTGYIQEYHSEIENLCSAKFSIFLSNVTTYQERTSFAESNKFVKKTLLEFNNFEKTLKSKLTSEDWSENQLKALKLVSGFISAKNQEILSLIKKN